MRRSFFVAASVKGAGGVGAVRVVGSEAKLPRSFSLSLLLACDGSRSVEVAESRAILIVSASLSFWVLGLLEGWEMEPAGESLSQLRMLKEV